MRRSLELALVVLALVGLPLGVAIVARSQPAAPVAAGAVLPAVDRRALARSGVHPVACRWTADHGAILCRLAHGGTCQFKPDGSGGCSTATSTWYVLVGTDHRP